MVIAKLRKELTQELVRIGVDAPAREARELLCAVLDLPLEKLLALPADVPVCERDCERLGFLLKRREQGVPIQYLIGQWDFYGMPFCCSGAALIPRPETELLVEQAVGWLGEKSRARALDLGCGTGCIGLALARETGCAVTLADLSEEAVALARRNAAALGVEAEFLTLDMLQPPPAERQWELIVSNPPYLTRDDMANLQREVRLEPAMALYGGQDGLDFYRALAEHWIGALCPGGLLLVEHGVGQGQAVATLFEKAGLVQVRTLCDYEGRDRMTMGEKPPEPTQSGA